MRTFSKVLAVVLCVAMLFTTAFASGLKVSFVDFQAGNGTVTARVNLRNDDSQDALSGKIIVASYDEEGNLIATGESDKTEVAKGAETIVSASVAAGAAVYKAFVWNDAVNANSVHAVAGATEKNDFTADTGVDNGKVSKNAVATTGMTASIPQLVLYSPFKGRTEGDESEATGGRVTISSYPANSKQYHETYYVDPALEGLDFFVFSAGTINYSAAGSPLLTFDVERDSEIIILATNQGMEFEGFDLTTAEEAAANGTSFAEGRYMAREFADALNAIGIRPTYAMAIACQADKDAFYEEVVKAVYDAASGDAKATFDTQWASLKSNAWTNPGSYTAMYTKTVTLDGKETAEVVIPAESTGAASRNLIVLVKPISEKDTSGAFVPLTSAGDASAAPALKGVEIDGTFVSIDQFTNNAYTHKLNALGDCVLPVVKGITADNAIYAVTDYEIASNAKTATITVTAKNLYTEATPVVYTINVEIDVTSIPADAYDIVNLNGTTIVDDTNVLKAKTITTAGTDTHGDPLVAAPVSVVNNMTYQQYIDYINEYYGFEEGDEGYISGTGSVEGTEKLATGSSFIYAKDFAIDAKLGAEGTRRRVATIDTRYAFYKDLYRLYGSIALNQANVNTKDGWFDACLYFGLDKTSSATGHYTNAATDKLPPVPWYTAEMKENGSVYVNAYCELPHLVQRGYTLISNSVQPYTGIDTGNNNAAIAGPTHIYYKAFEKGETVEIFNVATGKTNGHPPAWFFTTATRDEYSYEYGKKSSAAVATSFNSSLTDGVLYKDLFADVRTSSNTTGGRWVSDFHPLSSGQRIKSVEDLNLIGCDYFTFSINNRSKFGTVGGNILEFKVDKDCEVVIFAKSADSAAVFGDFNKKTDVAGLTGMFPQANFVETVKNMGIPATDISIEMVEDLYKSSGLTFKQVYDKWLGAYFPGATEEELLKLVNSSAKKSSIGTELYADINSVSAVTGSSATHAYTVSYTKAFSAGDTVAIPDPTGKAGFDRPIVVVVKPKLSTTIKDHIEDFKIVASTGAGSFIMGPGANVTASTNYSDRLTHNTETATTATYGSAYSINNQRIFGVTDEVLGLENCYYLKYVNQASVDSVLKGTAKAEWIGGTDQEDLAWMTFKVNQDCDVIVMSGYETPKFVTRDVNGWSKTTLSDWAFTLKRNGGDYTSNSSKTMYVKSFKAGDTVTLYNGNNGSSTSMGYDRLPYYVFVRVK